jgi:hypothetical protein
MKTIQVTTTTNHGLQWVQYQNGVVINLGGAEMARNQDAAKAGIGFGVALAIAISWSANKSILWAILHGIFSWFYVIYYAIRYQT